jgi:hypothetical protein
MPFAMMTAGSRPRPHGSSMAILAASSTNDGSAAGARVPWNSCMCLARADWFALLHRTSPLRLRELRVAAGSNAGVSYAWLTPTRRAAMRRVAIYDRCSTVSGRNGWARMASA